MGKFCKFLILVVLVLLFLVSCNETLQTFVRFQNNSASKTVYAIWDGAITATLLPGQITEYREVKEGGHTLQWRNAADKKDLTTIGWPSLVAGEIYTFGYND